MAGQLLDKIVFHLNQLRERGLMGQYAIGGAVAFIHHTEPFQTDDLDVFAHFSDRLDALHPIYRYLESQGARVVGEAVDIDGEIVQFLPVSNPLEEEAVAEAIEVKIGNETTRIMTAEHLIAIALRWGRAKDMQKIQRLLETPKKPLDMERLFSILRHYNLVTHWSRYRERYPDE
jgi:hypothetical protein